MQEGVRRLELPAVPDRVVDERFAGHDFAGGAEQGSALDLNAGAVRFDVHFDGEEAGGVLDVQATGTPSGSAGVAAIATAATAGAAVAVGPADARDVGGHRARHHTRRGDAYSAEDADSFMDCVR